MAKFKCLEHIPEDPHYRNCAFPLSYPTSLCCCSEPACNAPALLWLNPEEVREYERGERRFWDAGDLAVYKVDDQGLKCYEDPGHSVALAPSRRWGYPIRPTASLLRLYKGKL